MLIYRNRRIFFGVVSRQPSTLAAPQRSREEFATGLEASPPSFHSPGILFIYKDLGASENMIFGYCVKCVLRLPAYAD